MDRGEKMTYREIDRQTDRPTDRDRKTDRNTVSASCLSACFFAHASVPMWHTLLLHQRKPKRRYRQTDRNIGNILSPNSTETRKAKALKLSMSL